MNGISTTIFNSILQNLTDWLDIPHTYFERAQSRYTAIGNWLDRPESIVSEYDAEMFPRIVCLGIIKPSSDEDDYDIDLVCKLKWQSPI